MSRNNQLLSINIPQVKRNWTKANKTYGSSKEDGTEYSMAHNIRFFKEPSVSSKSNSYFRGTRGSALGKRLTSKKKSASKSPAPKKRSLSRMSSSKPASRLIAQMRAEKL
jgi:hypothetical protein